MGEIVRSLAYEQVLPLGIQEYAKSLTISVNQLEKQHGERLQQHGIEMGKICFCLS